MSCLGLCCFDVYTTHPRLHALRPSLLSLHLRARHVKALYAAFCRAEHPGDVAAAHELFGALGVRDSMFAKRVRAVTEFSKEVSFREFALSLWNYCSADPDTLQDLCFRMYLPQTLEYEDEINGAAMKRMLKDLYGDNYLLRYPKLSVVQKKLASLNDVPITLTHFKEFCQSHDLLKPAFETQNKLRTDILGNKFWADAVKKRMLVENEYVFKNDFHLKLEDTEKFFDLPWKPKPDSASSAQNHSRGNETLTRKVVQKLEDRERRRSFSKDQLREKEKKSSGGTDSTHDGLVKSPGDHPSLRKRRKSAEDLPSIDRTTKLEFQKKMGPTAHDMSEYKKDVLAIGSGKHGLDSRVDETSKRRQGSGERTRRRHSYGGNARVVPEDVGERQPSADKSKNNSYRKKSDEPSDAGSKKERRKNRRLTF